MGAGDMSQWLSTRGTRLVASPPTAEYIRTHQERAADPFERVANPDGYVALCTAENKLVSDLVLARLGAVDDVPARALGYDAMVGAEGVREKIAGFMARTFVGRPVDARHLVLLAGAGAVLESLFYAICDPGDGVLVPTPSYAGFWADLETRDELNIIPVHCSSASGFRLTPDLLDRALAEASCPVSALLFTSPPNPLGWVYDADEIDEVIEWADRRGLHVVFDEVYALSVYGHRPFVSAAQLRAPLGERVHVAWAFSKDFGASGLRAGVLVSENEVVLRAVDGLAYWSAVSGHTQHLLGEMVADAAWVDGYIAELQIRLRTAAGRVVAALDEIGVPHVPANAGIFVLCDVRPFMAEVSWAAEDVLWREILEKVNVNLTPGSACHVGEPGWMRLCFAAVPTDTAVEGIRRVGDVLRSR